MKTRYKILLTICIMLISAMLVLTACSGWSSNSQANVPASWTPDAHRFQLIEWNVMDIPSSTYYRVFYDTDTKVMYALITKESAGGLVMLVNPDGTPMLYEENK